MTEKHTSLTHTARPRDPESRYAFPRAIGSLIILLAMAGCGVAPPMENPPGRNGTDPSAGDTVSFARDIQPIFTINCAGCHSDGGIADLSGIELQLTPEAAYDDLVNQSSVQRPDLTLVVPGDPEASLLYLKVSRDDPPVGVRMPRSAPPLTAQEAELIRAWIEQGALNN